MRKKVSILFLVVMILCAAVFFGCDKNGNKDYFKFASESLEMTVGDAEYLVWDAEEGASVIFSSADSAIAAVDENGKVTAVSVGSCVITGAAGKAKDEIEIIVTEKKETIGVTLNLESYSAIVGEEFTLRAVVKRNGQTDENAQVNWTSSDVAVAAVGTDGKVIALTVGMAEIRAEYQSVTAKCILTVENEVEISFKKRSFDTVGGEYLDLGITTLVNGKEADVELDIDVSEKGASVEKTEKGYFLKIDEGFSGVLNVSARYEETEAGCIINVFRAVRTPFDFLAISNDLNGKYMLKNDIDFSGIDYKTIAHYDNSSSGKTGFSGILDGNGYALKNIDITPSAPYKNSTALFGVIKGGTVRNIEITGLRGTGVAYSGGVANINEGTIENVYVQIYAVSSTDNASYAFGGIANQNRGIVKDCIVDYAGAVLSGNIAGVFGRIYNDNSVDNVIIVSEEEIPAIFNKNGYLPSLETCVTIENYTGIEAAAKNFGDSWEFAPAPQLKDKDAPYAYFTVENLQMTVGEQVKVPYITVDGAETSFEVNGKGISLAGNTISAVSFGEATLIMKISKGGEVLGETSIDVTIIPDVSVRFKREEIVLAENQTLELLEEVEVSINGDDENDYEIEFYTEDIEYVLIEGTTLTPIKITVEPIKIYVKVKFGDIEKTAETELSVNDGITVHSNVDGVPELKAVIGMKGEQFVVEPTAEKIGEPAFEPVFSLFASSDIVLIDDMTITAVKQGSAEIEIRIDGVTYAVFTVKVVEYSPITTVEEFFAIDDTAENLKKNYLLLNDLDFGGYCADSHYTPIAAWYSGIPETEIFSGIFDGNGHALYNISNVYNEKAGGRSQLGVFGRVSGTIRNFNIINAEIKGDNYCGVVAHYLENGAVVENIYANAYMEVSGGNNGGIAAQTGNASAMKVCTIRNVVLDLNNTTSPAANNLLPFVAYRTHKANISDCFVRTMLEHNAALNGTVFERCGVFSEYKEIQDIIKHDNFGFLPVFVVLGDLEIIVGESSALPVVIIDTSAEITYEVSNEDFTIRDGMISASAAGTAVVTINAEGEAAEIQITAQLAELEIDENPVTVVLAVDGEYEGYNLNYNIPVKKALLGTEEAADKIIWTSGDSEILTISRGVITALKSGTTSVTAKLASIEKTVKVEVYAPIYDTESFMRINEDWFGNYILVEDIDFTGVNYTTIAHYNESAGGSKGFAGIFDGNGYAVKNLDIATAVTTEHGNSNALFGVIFGGTVRNLSCINIYSGRAVQYGAGLAGMNKGTIENCYVEYGLNHTGNFPGTIVGQNMTGGVVRNCIAVVTDKAQVSSSSGNKKLGYIVGKAENSVVENSFCIDRNSLSADWYNNMTKNASAVNCAKFTDISALYAGAEFTEYDMAIWLFDGEKIEIPHLINGCTVKVIH